MEALQEAISPGPRPSGMTDEAAGTPPPFGHQDRPGLELQEITNAMVRLHKELFGRGPTKARSDYSGPDIVIGTLENSLTAAERNKIALGEHQGVRETRTLLQHASERNFVKAIERITGRTVPVFVSGTDTLKDVSAEVFYLEPVATTEATKGD